MSFEENKSNKKAMIYFICGVLWILAASCYTISTLMSFQWHYVGLIILDIGIACLNFYNYKREKIM